MRGRLARAAPALAAFGLYAAATAVLTAPLLGVACGAFPHDAGDPVLNTWLLWWSTREVPLTAAWWNAPIFHPMRDAMALSEVLIGLLPITAPVQWLTGNPVAAYNAAFLLSFVLSGLAAYALVAELTGQRAAAVLAGLAFAFGPYRMSQLAHVQVLSYYGAPIALLGLHRYVRTGRARWLAVFGAAWLLQAFANGYALFHLSVLLGLWLVWFVRADRPLVPILGVWAVASLPLVPVLIRYWQVHERLHLARDINEIERFSADIASFASAPAELALWGGRLLTSQYETALFPGVTMLAVLLAGAVAAWRRSGARITWEAGRSIAAAIALAFAAVAASAEIVGPWRLGMITVGSFSKPFTIAFAAAVIAAVLGPWGRNVWRSRSMPAFYAVAGAAMYVLAFGPSPTFLGREVFYEPPYAWLMRLPGFGTLRVPARFAMLALLCQAVVLALVASRWITRPGHPGLRRLALVVLGAGLLADGWVRLRVEPAPARPPEGWTGAGAVLELPPGGPGVDFPAIYRSMFHRRPIVNGFSGYLPPHYAPLVHAIGAGELSAIEELAAYGGIDVLLDRQHAGQYERAVSALAGATPAEESPRWAAIHIPSKPRPSLPVGTLLAVAGVSASRQPQNVARLMDGRLDTAWGPESPQDGAEEVAIDLGTVRMVHGVVLAAGPFAFGFPRRLLIDLSEDGRAWRNGFEGETSVLTVRAALVDPPRVPVTITLAPASARFVRLRQVGRDAVVPWWIAELGVLGAP